METTVLTQVDNGNFRLRTRFLEHNPVTSPTTSQKKVTYPATLSPNFAFLFQGLLVTILLVLLFGHCLFQLLMNFISDRLQQFQAKLLLCESVNHSILSDSLQLRGLYSLPDSSVHGILQAGILKSVAIHSFSGSSNPGIEPESPALQADTK